MLRFVEYETKSKKKKFADWTNRAMLFKHPCDTLVSFDIGLFGVERGLFGTNDAVYVKDSSEVKPKCINIVVYGFWSFTLWLLL